MRLCVVLNVGKSVGRGSMDMRTVELRHCPSVSIIKRGLLENCLFMNVFPS